MVLDGSFQTLKSNKIDPKILHRFCTDFAQILHKSTHRSFRKQSVLKVKSDDTFRNEITNHNHAVVNGHAYQKFA